VLARELLALKVDAALAVGGSEPVNAFKAATSTVPIVFMSALDPVAAGIVQSLTRPGGNITWPAAWVCAGGERCRDR